MNELNIFDSLFNDVFGNTSGVIYSNCAVPRVDVKEEETAYTLEMELPGHNENDVKIQLEHDNLTISSNNEQKEEKQDKKTKYILKERRCANFERRFTLPADVDSESISASFKNGILTINMHKKENMAPKLISIEAC